MGRFSTSIGESEEITVTYPDGSSEVLKLKPLGWEDVNDLMMIGKSFTSENPENTFDKMTDDTIERMKKVILKTMKNSYPDEPEEELKAFAAKNFMTLIPIVLNMNFNFGKTDKLEKIKARLDARKVPSDKAG
jgi:dsDNA-binding SOS-regulon protein